LEINGPDLTEILSRNSTGWSEEDHESLPLRKVDSISEIRNKILKNMNLKRISHTDRLCGLVVRIPGYKYRDPGDKKASTSALCLRIIYGSKKWLFIDSYLPT
jgi:hypothetical protein